MSLQLQYGSTPTTSFSNSSNADSVNAAFWDAWQKSQSPFPTEPAEVTESKERGGFWQGIGADSVFGFLLEAGDIARDIITGNQGAVPPGQSPPGVPPNQR
ncbi:MAG: hypothetical protein HRU12_21700, partial [Phaeodactylibacter sp.]|nr:hypothetical protein [Phaeodactylibacter sp.]